MIRRLLFVLSAIFTALLAALTLAATGMLGPTEAAALTVETQARQEVPLALSQLELTPIPSEQTPTAIFLPLVFNSQKSHVATHGDILSGEMTSSDGSGNGSLEPPPIPNNHTFVATTAEFLDRYLSRDMLPDGRLTFTIAITAPIVPVSAIAVDTGRLTVGGLDYMVAKKRLAYFSMLQLHVYDVDHDAPGCPEVDLVSVNGNPIEHDLAPARLRSGDNVWDTWTISIPTLYLRFPVRTGDNTQPVLPAVNEISIDVDAQCGSQWALTVDWGAISIRPRLDYPMLLVHGWTGGPDTFQTEDKNDGDFVTFAMADDYRANPLDLAQGIKTVEETAQALMKEILDTVIFNNTEKVFLVAHSRGGIFTRAALRRYPWLTSMVAGYITISTPHHTESEYFV